MNEVEAEPAVPDHLLESLVDGARAAGELHLDAALVELRVELTADLLTRLKAACASAGVRLDEDVDDLVDPDLGLPGEVALEPAVLSAADELARARRRRIASRNLKAVKPPAGGSSDSVRLYLREIGRVPLLNAAEEVAIAKRIEAGASASIRLADLAVAGELESLPFDERRKLQRAAKDGDRAADELVQANLRLVVSIAKRYVGRGMQLLDLIQEGNLGLMRAVEKFDHRKGFKFSTYATWWIRQAIGRGIADKGRTIRLPSHLVDTMAVLSKTSATMLKALGREPTPEELAEETGLPLERVRVALRAAPDLVSLSASIGDDDGELGDLLADDSAEAPFDAAAMALARDDLRHLLDYLNPREREILSLRFGLAGDQPLTLDEVGRRYNVTRERVRQIEAKALTKLRHPCSARHRRLVSALGS